MASRGNRRAGGPAVGDPSAIAAPLRAWYLAARRDLPWRGTSDPYAIWLSEVMLQQTRVSVVIPYYERFLGRYPTVADLAEADGTTVLELWAGLGYYSRGRNLHRAAQVVAEEHGGAFPDTPEGLRALPGVGEYTAAAIGSIAFGHEAPVVDGNVERVLCRHGALEGDPKRGETRRAVRDAAERALDRAHPGDHNQAMMELGATVCVPRNPLCCECPVAASCRARELGEPERFPPPRVRRAPETQHWIAVVCGDDRRVWTVPRDGDEELLPGHRGVPLVRWEGEEPPSLVEARGAIGSALAAMTTDEAEGEPLPTVCHSITHRRLRIHPLRFRVTPIGDGAEAVALDDADRLAALFRKIVRVALADPVGSSGAPR